MDSKVEIMLSKFEMTDLDDLSRIMEMNIEAAGRNKDWEKFIQWNIDHPEDLYWKILVGDKADGDCETGSGGDFFMVGYIGYSDATKKPTSKSLALPGDLFLEIYLDPNYTGLGLGEKSFNESIRLMSERSESREPRKYRYTIFASTYISNVGASKFFVNKLKMKFIEYNKKFNTNLYSKVIN